MKRLSPEEWHRLSEDFFMALRYWRLEHLDAPRSAIAAELDSRWTIVREQILDDLYAQGLAEAAKTHPCPYCKAVLLDEETRLRALRAYADLTFAPDPLDRVCNACGGSISIAQRKVPHDDL